MIWNIRKQKQNKKKKKRINNNNNNNNNEGSISSLWDNFKRSNIHIIGMPEGEEKELNKMEVSNFRHRVQNTGYKDAQGT